MIRRPPRSTLFPYTTLSDLPIRREGALIGFETKPRVEIGGNRIVIREINSPELKTVKVLLRSIRLLNIVEVIKIHLAAELALCDGGVLCRDWHNSRTRYNNGENIDEMFHGITDECEGPVELRRPKIAGFCFLWVSGMLSNC